MAPLGSNPKTASWLRPGPRRQTPTSTQCRGPVSFRPTQSEEKQRGVYHLHGTIQYRETWRGLDISHERHLELDTCASPSGSDVQVWEDVSGFRGMPRTWHQLSDISLAWLPSACISSDTTHRLHQAQRLSAYEADAVWVFAGLEAFSPPLECPASTPCDKHRLLSSPRLAVSGCRDATRLARLTAWGDWRRSSLGDQSVTSPILVKDPDAQAAAGRSKTAASFIRWNSCRLPPVSVSLTSLPLLGCGFPSRLGLCHTYILEVEERAPSLSPQSATVSANLCWRIMRR